MMDIFSPYRWLLYLAMAASAVGGYKLWERHVAAPYIAAEAQQKKDADQLLKTETAKVEATMKQLGLSLATQEKIDAEHKQTSDQLGARLRRLAADNSGRLRDPAGCGAGSGSPSGQTISGTSPGAEDTSETSGVLSADLSRLLLDQARVADEINDAYASCRADSLNLRASLPAQLKGLKD